MYSSLGAKTITHKILIMNGVYKSIFLFLVVGILSVKWRIYISKANKKLSTEIKKAICKLKFKRLEKLSRWLTVYAVIASNTSYVIPTISRVS